MVDHSDQWMAWLDQHGPALVLLARQWVASRTDAEDVVQDAFIRFWRARSRVVDPVAYLFSSVKHCALDRRRSLTRQLRRDAAVARPEGASLFAGPAEDEERHSAVAAGLRQLPENQREVLVMKIWGELSFAQIGDALQISSHTAASRYRYAVTKLREQLTEESLI
jgi:RNA polymerase sigma factor (sigma-70 family)